MEAAVDAIRRRAFTAEMARSLGNTTRFEKTLVGWSALYGSTDSCEICSRAGLSPTAVSGGLCPMHLALSTNSNAKILHMLAAAGATMDDCDGEMADEYVRLLCSTRDVPLIKTLVASCGMPRPTDFRSLLYGYVCNAERSHAHVDDVVVALSAVRELRRDSPEWWQSIHPGQQARVLAFACCARFGNTVPLPREIVCFILGFLPSTTNCLII